MALKPHDPAGLEAFATAVSTPGSKIYGQYLSVAEFARRFGATNKQLDAVAASLRAHGLRPGRPSANHLSIPITATAGQLARAFSLSFSKLRLANGRTAVANTAAPLLDRSVAPFIESVVGLESVSRPQPLAIRSSGRRVHAARALPHVVTGGPQPCADARAAGPSQRAYTADQIASAYGFSGLYRAGDLGAGQTIAIYELESDDPADIAAYQSCYGTSAAVSYRQVDGGAGSGPGAGEAALDIEDVIGLAPRANIVVYQGPNSNNNGPGAGPYDTYNAIVSEDRARVVSTSWGSCEPLEGATDARAEGTLFQEAAAQGQSIASAAGDTGSEDCDGQAPDLSLQVDDPASQPFITGVGGTTLSSLGPPPGEVVWNNGGGIAGLTGVGPGASGGGISSIWPMPAYQATAPAALNVINGSSSGAPCRSGSGFCREVPDVSADADPNTGYLIYWNGGGSDPTAPSGWQGIGGSSAAAPTWAALIVLTDASRACAGSPVGFANPALYRVAGGAYSATFNDVTSGNNDYTGTNGGRFPAGPRFDMASGLGTPIGSSLASELCASFLRVANPGSQRSTVGSPVRLQLRFGDYRGASIAFSAAGLPTGLSLTRTGLVAGTPSRPSSRPATITLTDTGGQVASATFRWTVKFAAVLTSARPRSSCTRAGGRRHCTYRAPSGQTVHVARGRRARVSLRLLTSTGAALGGALISIADGRHRTSVRTGRSGNASFILAAGGNRSISLGYAGDARDYSASLHLAVRNR